MIPNYLDVSIRWLSILLLNTFASVLFFISLGKLLYNLAPRKAKDLCPVLRREKGTLRSQEFRVILLCILDRRIFCVLLCQHRLYCNYAVCFCKYICLFLVSVLLTWFWLCRCGLIKLLGFTSHQIKPIRKKTSWLVSAVTSMEMMRMIL